MRLAILLVCLLTTISGLEASDPSAMRLYQGTTLRTPSGRQVVVDQDYVCYTRDAEDALLNRISELQSENNYLQSLIEIRSERVTLLEQQVSMLESSLAQRDVWLEVEKEHTDRYQALLRDILDSNRSLRRRFPNLAKLLVLHNVTKEGLRRIP